MLPVTTTATDLPANNKIASQQTCLYAYRYVKSAYEPSGSSGRSLSRFQQHKATRSASTPPEWDASTSQGYPPALNAPVPIYTPGWREAL